MIAIKNRNLHDFVKIFTNFFSSLKNNRRGARNTRCCVLLIPRKLTRYPQLTQSRSALIHLKPARESPSIQACPAHVALPMTWR